MLFEFDNLSTFLRGYVSDYTGIVRKLKFKSKKVSCELGLVKCEATVTKC